MFLDEDDYFGLFSYFFLSKITHLNVDNNMWSTCVENVLAVNSDIDIITEDTCMGSVRICADDIWAIIAW